MRARVDVAIVGAGTAGSAAAALCAARGLRVACVDRRPLDEAGARWLNDVPAWMFAESGIEPPRGDEAAARGGDFHLVAGWGPERVVVRGGDSYLADMRLLVARLQRLARDAGAELEGGVRVDTLRDGVLVTSAGAIEAPVVVDASGLGGAGLIDAPPIAREHVCAAAQEVRRVRDASAARAYFAQHGARPGDVLCFTAVAGGYSIVNARLLDDERVALLTGSIPALGHPSGRALVHDFAARHPWVGAPIFGGARPIPLGPPHARIARGRVALLGDAALQVFSAHGSGIGAGLIAARLLADALADGRGLDGYAVAWQRRFGALHAAYDLFRRLSQSLDAADLAAMIRAGLLDEPSVRAGLDQRWPTIEPRALASITRGVARSPRLALRLAPVLARMPALRLIYATYPRDARALPRWSARRDRIAPALRRA